MSTEKLKELAKKVAELRRDCTIQGAKVFELNNILADTPEYRAESEARIVHAGLSGKLDIAQEELKATAVALYNETGEKKPIDKVEIKITKEFRLFEVNEIPECYLGSDLSIYLEEKKEGEK